MIDIHCHIIPSVDDGPASLEDSIAMAKKAVNEGINAIIATPHHRNGPYQNTKQEILLQIDSLNEELQARQIPLTIYPGQETRIFGEYFQEYEAGKILPLNHTQYVFIEFPSSHVPRYASQLIFDLQVNGLVPIIVHPERNQELIEAPDKLYQLVKKGALTQVTAASVTGRFGKNIKKFTNQLLRSNLTHFVASDAHNTTTRGFHLREAYEAVEYEFGVRIRYMLQENAEILLRGNTIYPEYPERIQKKKFLGLF